MWAILKLVSVKAGKIIPLLKFLEGYQKKYLVSDLNAGITLGVLLIPQGMAYAVLAGVPPVYGLYAGLIPPVIYALFGTSPHLSVGPVSITSILVFAGISSLETPGSEEYISLVILAGLLVGVLQIVIGVLRLGFIVNLLSRPVIAGFTSAAAIIIVTSQLDSILGFEIPDVDYFYEAVIYAGVNISQIHWIPALIFMLSIVLKTLLDRIHKRIPAALIVIVLATVLSKYLDLKGLGVDIIGSIPAGFPDWAVPDLSDMDIIRLIPTVVSLLMIGIVGSISLAKAMEAKHTYYEIQPNREMIGLGLAKVVGSLFQAMPTDGSFARSSVASETGGRTSLSSVFAALLVGLCLLYFTSLLHFLPMAVLSAVIVMAVLGLIEYREAVELWRIHRSDFIMMIITFFVTLILGILDGVIWGVLLSVLVILYKSMKPRIVELGRIEETIRYGALDRPDVIPLRSDFVVVRFEDQLYFANAAYFKNAIREKLKSHGEGVAVHLILDASAMHDIDSTGIHALREIREELKLRGITIHFAEVIGPVRKLLHISGLLEEEPPYISIHNAIREIENTETVTDSDKIPGDPGTEAGSLSIRQQEKE